MSTGELADADAGGRFIHPFDLGGLRVTPLTGNQRGAPLGLDLAEAEEFVAVTGGLAYGLPASGQRTVGYGSVTLSGVALPSGAPTFRGRHAWIGIYLGSSSTGITSCPAVLAPKPGGTSYSASGSGSGTYQPVDSVVIFYGVGGLGAVLYRTGGTGPCGGISKPSVTNADAEVQVPWIQLRPPGLATPIGYRAPTCSQLSGVGASGNVHTGVVTANVTIVIPLDRTGCRAVQWFTTTLNLFPIDPVPGAPPPPSRIELQHDPVQASIPPSLVGPLAT